MNSIENILFTRNLIENLTNKKSYLKPTEYKDISDLISFIRGKNTNQIKITEVNDEN